MLDGVVCLLFMSVLDLGIWLYMMVVVDVVDFFDLVISDLESVVLEWVLLDVVDGCLLYFGFVVVWLVLW